MKKGLTIAAPSWKRPDSAFTHKYFNKVQYVVCQSQAEEYRKNELPVWECPDSAQGNLCRVRNWILDNCPTKWLLIVDDDLSALGRWNGNEQKRLNMEEATEAVEHGFGIAEQCETPFWGINCIPDKGAYREYTPFSFNNYIGGPFQAFLPGQFEGLRYDENLPLKEDYDLTIQAANKFRKVLRINYLFYFVKQHTNKGGCADYRTIQREKEQFDLLQKKWGSKIVKRDNGSKTDGKRETTYDLNPIIRVPIGGV